ncbi:MAG: acyl-CoA/acyl-ACP dehydrogenase [Pseudomonadales bacterium]|nr:acyl-CoA/acyl-ACP dehydrogenase [Pseudomonadales bacterium]
MNFEFSEEQNMLREQARGFLQDNCSLKVVREVLEGDGAFNTELWQKVAEMGWTSTVIPEEYGGLGLGYIELSVIAEELGRALCPLPFSSSVYLASEAILNYGSHEQKEKYLPRLATGEIVGTFALAETRGRASPATILTTGTDSVSGEKIAVADGDIADFAIVVVKASSGDGASLAIVDLKQANVKREKIVTLDPSRSHANITFSDATGELLGEAGAGWAATQNVLNRAAILFAWEQNGGSEAALEMAKEYALGRFAFGRAIASYQAIKHKLANVYVKNTLARSNCYYGAWALDTNAADLPVAAAASRVAGIQAYYFASKENIQTHGGMGFTWEFDCQFHYRRSKILSVNVGSEGQWQDKLITAIEQQNAAEEGASGL